MYFKRLRPYVIELASFLVISTIFVIAITFSFGGGSIQRGILIAGILLLFIWLPIYVFSFVIFAIRVIIDLIFKKYETTTATFVGQFPFKSSSFLDKNSKFDKEKGIRKIETLYYKVLVKRKDVEGFTTLTSTEFFDLLPGVKYEFVFGRFSRAIVDVRDSDERVVRFYRGVKLHKKHDIEKKKGQKKKCT